MVVKFLADSDLNERIVRGVWRREASLDILSAHQGGVIDLPDPEVLRIAAEAGRVLISSDAKTMPRHFGDFCRTRSSPGLVIVPQKVPISIAIEEIRTIWAASKAEEWRNVYDFIPLRK
jgi:predicted nuclease of predicted toxin-antitoxin system